MAQTDFGSLDDTKKVKYLTSLFMQGRETAFFLNSSNGLFGKGNKDASKPVHFVNELTADPRGGGGTKCIMPLVLDLVGDGVVDDNKLEGSEEELVADVIEINISQIRNGVKNTGRLSDQSSVINFRAQARDKLSFWKSDKLDEIMFLVATGVSLSFNLDGSTRGVSQLTQMKFAGQITAPTSGRQVFAGAATSTATLTTTDTMKWSTLVDLKARLVAKRIKPIRVNGKNTYAIIMHPYQARDLKKDADYQNSVRNGDERGKNVNALFTGAFVMVDGLALFEHNKIVTTAGKTSGNKYGSGGTVDGAIALAVGAQALGYAEIGTGTWDETNETDYGNQFGLSYSCMMGVIKPVFKTVVPDERTLGKQDFAIFALYTACKLS